MQVSLESHMDTLPIELVMQWLEKHLWDGSCEPQCHVAMCTGSKILIVEALPDILGCIGCAMEVHNYFIHATTYM